MPQCLLKIQYSGCEKYDKYPCLLSGNSQPVVFQTKKQSQLRYRLIELYVKKWSQIGDSHRVKPAGGGEYSAIFKQIWSRQQCTANRADSALAGPLQPCLLTGVREGFWIVSSPQVMVNLLVSWEAAFGGSHWLSAFFVYGSVWRSQPPAPYWPGQLCQSAQQEPWGRLWALSLLASTGQCHPRSCQWKQTHPIQVSGGLGCA